MSLLFIPSQPIQINKTLSKIDNEVGAASKIRLASDKKALDPRLASQGQRNDQAALKRATETTR